MAKTYIGYAQREKETNVNWGAVATGFTDLLNEQRKTKEDNEAADALATEQLATTLQNSPEGGDRESSDYILDYVNNASNYNLMLKRQLDSGNMSRKQFTTLTQNLTNGTAQIVAITNKYNSYLQNQEKRMKEATDIGGQAAQDVWNAGKVQSFADFRDNAAFIDPTTMKVSQGKLVDKVVDGKTIRVMSENTGDFTQVSTMLGWMGQEIDKFDLNKAIDDTYKTLAPSYQTNMLDGSIKDDIRNNPKFEDAVNKKLGAYLNDPRAVASILADYAGMSEKGGKNGSPAPWEFTDDVKRENNPDSIYLTPDSAGNYNIDLKSKQGIYLKEQALDYMKSQLDLKIPKKTTKAPGYTPPKFNQDYQDYLENNRETKDATKNFMNLKNTSGDAFKSAANFFINKSMDDGSIIQNIEQNDNGLTITTLDANNNTKTFPINFGEDNQIEQYLNQGIGLIGTSSSNILNLYPRGENASESDNNIFETTFGGSRPKQRDTNGNIIPINTENRGVVTTDIPYNETTVEFTKGNKTADISPLTLLEQSTSLNSADSQANNIEAILRQSNPNQSTLKELGSVVAMSKDYGADVDGKLIEIYYPKLMSGPIYVDSKKPGQIDRSLQLIYNAINKNENLEPLNFKAALGDLYNSQEDIYKVRTKEEGFPTSGVNEREVIWNAGRGRLIKGGDVVEQQKEEVKEIISTVAPKEIKGYVFGESPMIQNIKKANPDLSYKEQITLWQEARKHFIKNAKN